MHAYKDISHCHLQKVRANSAVRLAIYTQCCEQPYHYSRRKTIITADLLYLLLDVFANTYLVTPGNDIVRYMGKIEALIVMHEQWHVTLYHFGYCGVE